MRTICMYACREFVPGDVLTHLATDCKLPRAKEAEVAWFELTENSLAEALLACRVPGSALAFKVASVSFVNPSIYLAYLSAPTHRSPGAAPPTLTDLINPG